MNTPERTKAGERTLSSRQRRLDLDCDSLRLLTSEPFTWDSQIHVLTARERRDIAATLRALQQRTERLVTALQAAGDELPMALRFRERSAASL